MPNANRSASGLHQRPPDVINLQSYVGVPIGVDVGDGDGSVQVTVRDARGARAVVVSGSRPQRVVPSPLDQPRPQAARVPPSPPHRSEGRGAMVLWDLLLGLLAVVILGVVALNLTGVLSTRVVLTGSMSPVINPADVVVTVPVSSRTPVVGDIVTYTAQRFDGSQVAPLTHRIIAVDADGRFITKGDANVDPDVQHPTLGEISGVVVAIIPKVGVILQPLVLLGVLVVIIAVWLAADWARRRP